MCSCFLLVLASAALLKTVITISCNIIMYNNCKTVVEAEETVEYYCASSSAISMTVFYPTY